MNLSLILIAVLLLIGVGLRQSVAILKKLFIPASVVAGFIGLAAVSLLSLVGGDPMKEQLGELTKTLSGWPGPLITIVFAAMMLQPPSTKKTKGDRSTARRVGRQGLMVWIIVLGETFVGLLATWVLILPRFEVPNSFGFLIETGFAGGHGTATAMGQVYASKQVGFGEIGLDLGLLMATCGLVYGLVSGILWINVAARMGWITKPMRETTAEQRDQEPVPAKKRQPIGFTTLSLEAIDPLLLQAVWVILAVGLGVAMQSGVMWLAQWGDFAIGAGSATEGAGSGVVQAARVFKPSGLSVVHLHDAWWVASSTRPRASWKGRLDRHVDDSAAERDGDGSARGCSDHVATS